MGKTGPAGCPGILLHGLYVTPTSQAQGHGRRLQCAVFNRAYAAGAETVLVKAERVSVGYFEQCGYRRMPDAAYPYTVYFDLRACERAEAARPDAVTDACRANARPSSRHLPCGRCSPSWSAA